MVRKGFKWTALIMIAVMLMSALAGCGGNNNANEGGQSVVETPPVASSEPSPSPEGEPAASFPITLTDDAGNTVTIEEEPQSIVTLWPSNTETTFALGAGGKVVGVSDFCNYPLEVNDLPKLGGQDFNAEKILELAPDLVLLSDSQASSHPEIIDQFKQAGIAVVVIGSASSFADAYGDMRLIGQVTGTSDKAEAIIADMETRLQAIKDKAAGIASPKKVWIEVSPAPDIYTTGKGTFMHEMLEAINAVNVAGDQEGWVKMTEEQIVETMPDTILTTYGYYVENPTQTVLAREGWQEVPAVKNAQVFDVDSDSVTRPGPRLIDGVEEIAKAVYPETFQ